MSPDDNIPCVVNLEGQHAIELIINNYNNFSREISYRHKIVKLAVLVESTYGLGEALVSDLATPAYYEILIHSNENGEIRLKIIEKKVKALSDEYE
ncbi:unnamed protein product [Rotaria socialis]|uniref:Uncharacterized protein n=1 Tax=Rotaria socialis TaxID=392032 RepID=A0A818URW3_9BILA|nr:unnamed protein product [Rotaria socialis]CAF4167478.1 unnamed protein product [Rotaria socialis]CAF4595307.1 unnamed protein product [Rotaria socialis]